MNKKELKGALEELKIDFNPDATNDELRELLKEAEEYREKEEKTEEKAEKEEVKEPKEEEKPKKVEITKACIYLSPRGISDGEQLVRTYTEEQSDDKDMKGGKTFIEKAEGYALKIGGTVKLK